MSINYDNFSSAADYRKKFYEIGKPIFENHGFQFKNNCFYRKNGDTFQALTLEHRCGRMGLLVVPFWCDIPAGGMPLSRGPFSEQSLYLSSHLSNGKVNIDHFISNQVHLDPEYNFVSKLGEGIELFLKSFDSQTIPVVDEITYIKYMIDSKRSNLIAEDAVIYASYRSGSVDFAQHFIDEVDSLNLRLSVLRYEHGLSPGKLVSEFGEKQEIDELFLNDYFRNYRCRFSEIYKYIETGKTDIGERYEKASLKMRELYKKHLKLIFKGVSYVCNEY